MCSFIEFTNIETFLLIQTLFCKKNHWYSTCKLIRYLPTYLILKSEKHCFNNNIIANGKCDLIFQFSVFFLKKKSFKGIRYLFLNIRLDFRQVCFSYLVVSLHLVEEYFSVSENNETTKNLISFMKFKRFFVQDFSRLHTHFQNSAVSNLNLTPFAVRSTYRHQVLKL